jgi:uncharacterized membrane protein
VEAIGPILILLSFPFLFRWVPQNRFYGFRVPATCRNKSVWYDANVLFARHAIALGALLIVLEFIVPARALVMTLRLVAIVGLLAICIVDWRTANRWERERSTPLATQR